ncbi:hypothetical protein PVAP13_7NG020856 [Panicum virgatum]|uniref:Uncharacterized protein n=1 Tax=Panicum virgatum TaxID=38727 RepID=A0A8T0PZW2_PANVG|nr:hypothetical protein PVAP13_7NG020856 [Panicum virgatum]
MHLDAYFWFIYTCEERRRASTSSAPPLPLCFPCRLAPHRRPSSSPSPSTRLRREEEPQRLDPGAAASIPCEKGEGSGDIYSQLSLSLSARLAEIPRWSCSTKTVAPLWDLGALMP